MSSASARCRPALAALALFSLSFVTLGAACSGGASSGLGPRGPLAPGGDAGGAASSRGPLSVVFAAPRGEATDAGQITLVMSRPMRPLDIAGEEAAPFASITPSIRGRWQWVGTTGLIFVPEGRLPRATALRVEVPAGTKALDGTSLASPFRMDLSTARPKVVSVTPSAPPRRLDPKATFAVRFNQPVDDAEAARAISMTAAGKRVLFDIHRPDPKDEARLELSPRAALPLDSDVGVRVAESLRGTEGPLVAGEPSTFNFETYSPLQVAHARCSFQEGPCSPGDNSITIQFTNQVTAESVVKAVQIEPPIPLRADAYDNDDGTTDIWLRARLAPSSKYRVRVRAGLRDKYGQALASDFERTVTVGPIEPEATIGLEGSIFEPSLRRDVPIISVNLPEIDLVTAPLTEQAVLDIEGAQEEEGRPRWEGISFSAVERVPSAKRTTLKPASALNTAASHLVRADDFLSAKSRRGAFAVAIQYKPKPSEEATVRAALVQVTDLGITAKVSRHGSIVRVTRLSTTEPVAGASVSVRRPQKPGGASAKIEVVRTDAEGFATIPASMFEPKTWLFEESAVIFASLGDDWAFRRVRDVVDVSGFPASLHDPAPLGLVFAERPIYRPGDVVKLKGIFREQGKLGVGLTTPAGKEATIEVTPPGGKEQAFTKKLSPFGTMSAEMKIPADAKLGHYRISGKTEAGDLSSGSHFEVAEYRPNEARVTVKSERPSYVRGEKARFFARGEYLFGAPVQGGSTASMVGRGPAAFTPPGVAEDLVTDDAAYRAGLRRGYGRYLVSNRDRLDARGNAELTVPLVMDDMQGPEEITCFVEITDESRQAVSGQTKAIVHPADIYVAMKPPADFIVPARRDLRPEVLVTTPEGARAPGVSVRVELIERTWKMNTVYGEREPVDRPAASCALTSHAAPAACSLAPPAPGYYILRATAVDKRGNTAAASSSIYAIGEGEPTFAQGSGFSVELVPDKKVYDIGQKARIAVKSPFPSATALVTVERGSVRSRRTVALKGPAPLIEVPITDEMWPNAYVSVALLRGTGALPKNKAPASPAPSEDDPAGAAAFRIGYAELPLRPDTKRLRVALTPSRTEARPGSPVDIDVMVRDHGGAPVRAEVTLYAVDEGVLSLAEEKTPDPLAELAKPRPLEVVSIESRTELARVVDPNAWLSRSPRVRMGAGSVGFEPRQEFRTVAYYNPSLLTDAAGRARASFKLPDNLTSYKLTAVVVTEDDRAGNGEAKIVTSLPLMARPSLPRFLRAGDSIEAGVVVTSKLPGKARVEVEAQAFGLLLAGDAKRTIELGTAESKEVRFSLAAPKVGTASLRFTAKTEGAADAVSVKREIRAPGAVEAVALYGQTDASSEERLGDLSSIRDDVGGLDVRLSSSALVGLDGGVQHLLDYPYACTEQLTSRLLPLLPLRELARTYSITLPGNTDALVASTIAKIAANQRSDGAFGLWPGSPEVSAWVTAYALFGLGEAKRYGARVPAGVLEKATRYLTASLDRPSEDPEDRAAAAFILDVLAQSDGASAARAQKGQAPSALQSKISSLYSERAKLPLFGKALLAHALVKSGAPRAQIERITAELEGALRLDGPTARAVVEGDARYHELLDSDTRTSALVLRALLAARAAHPLARALATGLLADRRGGTWRTTQETAWSLLALDQYRRAEEAADPDFLARVSLGGSVVHEAPFRGRTLAPSEKRIPASSLAGTTGTKGAALTFAKDGGGLLFYEARLRYVPRTPSRQPLDRGFFIKKTLRAVSPEGLPEALAVVPEATQATLPGGALVLADIVVVTPSPRQYVVVDDPLPAGLEPVDTGLASTSQWLREALSDDRSSSDPTSGYAVAWAREELRDDRALFFVDRMPAGMFRFRYLARATTPGAFAAPPSRVEEMYTPEVFGRLGADIVRVTAK